MVASQKRTCTLKGVNMSKLTVTLPDDFVCPLCGVGKDMFEEQA